MGFIRADTPCPAGTPPRRDTQGAMTRQRTDRRILTRSHARPLSHKFYRTKRTAPVGESSHAIQENARRLGLRPEGKIPPTPRTTRMDGWQSTAKAGSPKA